MQTRILVAVLALGGVAGNADAVTVRANIAGVLQPDCLGAENIRFTPAASRGDMRFTYECPSEGVARTCVPAAATSGLDPLWQVDDPAFKYEAFATTPLVTVICDADPAAPFTLKGTEISGTIDGQPIVGCHPASPLEPGLMVRVSVAIASACPTGNSANGTADATCLEFQCPQDTSRRACFLLADTGYAPRLADNDAALRRVSVDCETLPPMLTNSFDD